MLAHRQQNPREDTERLLELTSLGLLNSINTLLKTSLLDLGFVQRRNFLLLGWFHMEN